MNKIKIGDLVKIDPKIHEGIPFELHLLWFEVKSIYKNGDLVLKDPSYDNLWTYTPSNVLKVMEPLEEGDTVKLVERTERPLHWSQGAMDHMNGKKVTITKKLPNGYYIRSDATSFWFIKNEDIDCVIKCSGEDPTDKPSREKPVRYKIRID